MTVDLALMLAGSGFLLAVLWMDLIFDTQVRGGPGRQVPEPALASIAGYYRRATTTSHPMSRLIAMIMLTLVGALVFRGIYGHDPWWLTAVSSVLAGGPILLALVRTVPNAVRLGSRSDDPARQSRLARSIHRDHLVCFVSLSAFLAVWLINISV